MKRDFLKSLFEDENMSMDEKINKIMEQNGSDINGAKGQVDLNIYTKKSDYDDLNNKYTSLNSEFDAYKESTKDYADIKEKYSNLVKEQELNKRVSILNSLNCKHSDLLVDKVDWTKYNEENHAFDNDYLKSFKDKYNDLFKPEEVIYKPKSVLGPTGSYDGKDPKKMTKEELQKL